MAHYTQHQLTLFYNEHSKVDVTFNKHIISVTKLIPSEIYIKCGPKNYSCILNSSSMEGARIIMQTTPAFFEELTQVNKWVSLRFAFRRADKHFPLTFFIKSKVESFNPFNASKPDLYFLNLIYAQRPPDDLIELLGSIIEMNSSAQRRKNERIVLGEESLRELKIKSTNTVMVIGQEKKTCIIRDISFFGAKVITTGKPDAYKDKDMKIVIPFNGEPGNCLIDGKVVRCDPIKAKDDFVLLGLHFDEDKMPLAYTRILKEYLDRQQRLNPDNKTE